MAAVCKAGTEGAASPKNVRPVWAGQQLCPGADCGYLDARDMEEQGGRVGCRVTLTHVDTEEQGGRVGVPQGPQLCVQAVSCLGRTSPGGRMA